MNKLLPFLLLFLAACETTVDLPEPPHTPRAALLYTLTTHPQDSSFYDLYAGRQLFISNSQSVFSQASLGGRADASVELRDETGSVVERYRAVQPDLSGTGPGPYIPLGYYRPVLGYQPQPGRSYTLRATLPGLETAESTLTLPPPAVVESGTFTPRVSSNPGEMRGRLTVVLRDDPATTNYYLAFARVLDQNGDPSQYGTVNVDYSLQSSEVDIGQFQLSSPQQDYSLFPFADTDGNGQRITLGTDVTFYDNCYMGNCPPVGFIEVHVSSITRETYNFYLSQRRYYDSDGNPFAEPAPLASNVQHGYGLFGGATDVTYRIKL